jgi:hypothetical protein
MNLTKEQLHDIRAAVRFYQQHHISIGSPRYEEYEVILELLKEYKETQ